MKRILLFIFILCISQICIAQSKTVRVTLKSGAILTGVIQEMDASSHIVMNIAGLSSKINMSDIESITELESSSTGSGQVSEMSPDYVSPFPNINESGIHGSYIKKGNCVYVAVDSPYEYERAGQIKLRELMKEWGYWTVVDKPQQAHFILQMLVMIKNQDQAVLLIRTRSDYARNPRHMSFKAMSGCFTDSCSGFHVTRITKGGNYEEVDTNERLAMVFTRYLKRILSPESSGWDVQKDFQERASQALNADNDNHYSALPRMHLIMMGESTYTVQQGLKDGETFNIYD